MAGRRLIPVLAFLLLLSPVGSGGDRGPSTREIKKAIAEYFGADEGRRAELLEFLDDVPPLKKRDVGKWLKTIAKEMTARILTEAKEENGADFRKFDKQGAFHVTAAGLEMKYYFRPGGRKGKGGVPLLIYLHGGGADAATNESAWNGEKTRYAFAGCTIAPRAPRDTTLSWSEPEIWPLFDRVLAESFLLRGVDPDRVYVHGYSMGGWGTLLLGPAMADRFAAVGSSAGGEAVMRAHPQNLRNTPMIIQIGTEDHMFQRYELSRAYAERLRELAKADPKGYVLEYREHQGKGHQISDGDTPKWLSGHVRDPYPAKVVWKPLDVTKGYVRTFYYLAVDKPASSMEIVVSRDGNRFTVERAEGVAKLDLLLNDEFVDLDEPVVVLRGERELFSGRVERRLRTLLSTFGRRADRRLTFSARLTLEP